VFGQCILVQDPMTGVFCMGPGGIVHRGGVLSKAIGGLKEESGISEETQSRLDAFISAVNTKIPKLLE